jgi:colicin import membrane protein
VLVAAEDLPGNQGRQVRASLASSGSAAHAAASGSKPSAANAVAGRSRIPAPGAASQRNRPLTPQERIDTLHRKAARLEPDRAAAEQEIDRLKDIKTGLEVKKRAAVDKAAIARRAVDTITTQITRANKSYQDINRSINGFISEAKEIQKAVAEAAKAAAAEKRQAEQDRKRAADAKAKAAADAQKAAEEAKRQAAADKKKAADAERKAAADKTVADSGSKPSANKKPSTSSGSAGKASAGKKPSTSSGSAGKPATEKEDIAEANNAVAALTKSVPATTALDNAQ